MGFSLTRGSASLADGSLLVTCDDKTQFAPKEGSGMFSPEDFVIRPPTVATTPTIVPNAEGDPG